jgi:NAD(P)-dependent dehydrogenase (short-subunit alcohol dehydrogenase family)
MKQLAGRVAVVTGGGSGIGRGMALAFAEAGMHVALADIEGAAADKVAAEVVDRGVRALPVVTDVAKLSSVQALADRVEAELGGAHVLCNNAGVAHFGPLAENRDDDWEWLLSVNLKGVANGLQVFLPRMLERGEPAHIVNTASMAGLIAVPTLGIYTATKYAVVGITETLHQELAETPASCSVLCPGVVNTGIFNSERNRPDTLGGPGQAPLPPEARTLMEQGGKDPLEVGRMVRQGVLDDELYIFSHPEAKDIFDVRAAAIDAAFDRWSNWTDQ